MPGGGIASVSASHDSPYGRIGFFWKIANERLTLDVEMSPGMSAEVVLPTSVQVVGSGMHRFEHTY